MRKNLFYAGALMASMVFTACNNDDAPFKGEELAADGQQLSIVLNPAGNNSRAGRPLLSSAAMQAIDNVTLYVVDKNNRVVLKKVIGEGVWSGATGYGDNVKVTDTPHGKEVLVSFKGSENQSLEEDGVYTMYAVGYTKSSESDYTFTPDKVDDGSFWNTVKEEGHEDWNSFSATLKSEGNSNPSCKGEEVFAGSLEVKVVTIEDDGVKKSVLRAKDETGYEYTSAPNLMLYRQVAGVTGYFTGIPVDPKMNGEEPRYLRLVASNMNKTVVFKDLNNASSTTQTGTNAKTVINGQDEFGTPDATFQNASIPAYTVYEIDLHKFYPVDEQGTYKKLKDFDIYPAAKDGKPAGDGKLNEEDVKEYLKSVKNITDPETAGPADYKDFWRNPRNWNDGLTSYNHVQSLVLGSVWGAEFLVPFAHKNCKTMELQLLDADHKVLKVLNVNIPESDLVKAPADGNDEPSTGVVSGTVYDVSKSIYSIYRNHMYSLGMKADTTPTDPTDPTDPEKPIDPVDPTDPTDPDPENPEDISGGQDLLIKVNDNWEIIHNMEID